MAEQAAPVLPDVPNGDSLRGRELSPGVALNKLPPLNAKGEAVLITHTAWHPAGSRCGAKATHVTRGRSVCWCHWMAATKGPRATWQSAKVEFVGGGAE